MLCQSELPLLAWRLYREAGSCSGGRSVRRHVPRMCAIRTHRPRRGTSWSVEASAQHPPPATLATRRPCCVPHGHPPPHGVMATHRTVVPKTLGRYWVWRFISVLLSPQPPPLLLPTFLFAANALSNFLPFTAHTSCVLDCSGVGWCKQAARLRLPLCSVLMVHSMRVSHRFSGDFAHH